MSSPLSQISCLLFSFTCFLLLSYIGASKANRKAYIVYMGDRPKDQINVSSLHTSMLREVIGSDASKHLLHSYKRSFNGFSGMLTEEEMQKLKEMDGVISVFPSEKKQVHTTRSWDFMNFSLQVKRSSVESDIIIGMFDSGIWPESKSFSDEGFSPPPSKWKGICQTSSNFACNNKIIGARYYKADGKFDPNDLQSPRDSDGHGTHTASIAAGNAVHSADLMGLGMGTARGGVPLARIAVYKVCWSHGCFDYDILKAFDDAIADGVDIISLSLGGKIARDYFTDVNAIGAFHAMRKQILTSHSAGNNGPNLGTTSSVSPWSLSVAASTIDRKFLTKVQLGNNMIYTGVSINTFELQQMFPLIYARDAPNTRAGFDGSISRFCINNSLDETLVKGKIILCDIPTTGEQELLAGAVGSITRNGYIDVAYSQPLPASLMGLNASSSIYNYIKSTSNPTAIIMKSTEGKDEFAPYVASISSRGPNRITRDILKPDLAAPGIDILAAWSPIAPISGSTEDNRTTPYNIISGTSMACPHVTGAAAYIKSYRPTWSPAAIKSALMTTAYSMNPKINGDVEFAYGAGHINPIKAINPGLVYDANEVDYVNFLCGQGYSSENLKKVTGDDSSCSESTKAIVWDLNYPSFALYTPPMKSFTRTFHRTVTNVGTPISTYKVNVIAPPGLKIMVEPSILTFKSLGERLSFAVTVEGIINQGGNTIISASMVWYDDMYQVRSPIVVYDFS